MENIWHLRKVADTAAKACYICYKPSSSVLITPDNKDFFYVCPSHLKDTNFCTPTESEATAIAERKKQEELDQEIERVKQEYEAKMKKKEAKRKEKQDKKEKEDKKGDKESDEKDEKEKEEKIKALTSKSTSETTSSAEVGPRVFALKKHFYQMRLEKMRNAEIAKRNRDRLRNPSLFPSVPSGNP
ncbi:hypothetical protein AAFC00_003743 [Neodothiora populina]|uniref:DUF1742-domain-containing protein n=1 Tax=Neodothiora populina TaxID=2781224 RepID=A0ABR3PFA6_9PEZI